MRSRAARSTLLCAAGLLGATGLVACSGDDGDGDGPDAAAAVAALAEGLAAGDLGAPDGLELSVPVADAQADHDEVVEGLGEVEPEVAAGGVEESGTTATATLTWTWPVGPEGEEWTYDATAALEREGETWQVAWERSIIEPSLRGGTVLDRSTIPADRGDILGAGGAPLVTERPVVRVGIDRSQVSRAVAVASARELGRLTGVDVAPYVAQVRGAGDRQFVEAIVFRSGELPRRVEQGTAAIEGALLLTDELPLGPTRGFAAPILGTVGPVTAEMIEEDPEAYEVGDEAGLSGLQQRYDAELRGGEGVRVAAVASDGRERELFRSGGGRGRPLRTTLHLHLQLAAERVLAGVGPASALVAVRPSDGAVLAAANGPGTGGYNVATFGQLAPGSTFKAVSTLALLRSGLGPDATVQCPPTTTVDGKVFGNYSDYPSSALGAIPFRTALAQSCNTAFIGERGRLGRRELADAAASLGMGIDHDLGFPAYFGSVEPPATETEAAADLIGQGTILASPMVMATVVASVQRGELVVPRLLEEVEVTPPDHTPLTRDEARTLQAMLRGVVTGGSGSQLADVPGPPVIAKTGTAEFERRGRLLTHAWMIAAQGDLAVAVFVELGASGSRTAGPLVEEFLRAAR